MSEIRAMLAEIMRMPEFVADLEPGDNLILAGVNSGDVIRLVAMVEQRYAVEVDADAVERLTTIGAFEELVATQSAAG